MKDIIAPFSRPVYIMAKPAGAACNMRCAYCYYIDKQRLSSGGGSMMSDWLLEEFIRQYIECQTMPQVLFTWHGGEPLLRGLGFYEKVMKIERKYASGRQIDNCLQTNGTLIDDDIARFLHDNGWLTGVSIDGPEYMHDAFRRDISGKGTFQKVMAGINILERHNAQWNAMAVISKVNVKSPGIFYDFFKSIDCRYLQFTPLVDSTGLGKLTPWSITPEEWGRFLCELFDEWVSSDVGEVFVQLFDAVLANWVGVPPGICSLSEYCGQVGVMTHEGDIYSCDHFVYPHYKLGNIMETPLSELMYSRRQSRFGMAKSASLPVRCRQCRWLFTCWGECPKNRFISTSKGEEGVNWLCGGYKMFFSHVAPYMSYMKQLIGRGHAPAEIMEVKSKDFL